MTKSATKCWIIFFGAITSIGISAITGGCCGDGQCEPPLSNERTDVSDISFYGPWTRTDLKSFRIIVTTGPYRIRDYALTHLCNVMNEQVSLEVEVVEGTDTGLPGSGVLNDDDVINAGRAQIPTGDDAVAVIVVVSDTTCPDATYGFIDYDLWPRPTAVIVLHHNSLEGISIGPISPEMVEAATMVHEVGHWFEVPARDFHTSAIDGAHCTNARCVMFKGSRINECAVLANLCTGFPMRFCPDCAEELAEMKRRREANR